MDFSILVKERFSCRSYLSKLVEREKLLAIFDAVRFAPSAKNLQPFKFFVFNSSEVKQKLVKIYVREWFVNAPIVVACCVDYSKAWLRSDAKNYGDVDAAIAVDHLTLAAAENGLATCWVANFDVSVAESEFDFGENYKPLAFIALGYPADSSQKKVRKEIKDFVEFK